MLKTKEEIKSWLDKYHITDYTINDDLTVDTNGSVDLYNRLLTEIPIQFNKVKGNFYCDNNSLTSLIGAPKEVYGAFDCSYNKLTLLEGRPKEVKGNFWCSDNSLTSLAGCPEKVKGNFYCDGNLLTSLKHLPNIPGELVCDEHLYDTREYKVWLIGYKLKEMV